MPLDPLTFSIEVPCDQQTAFSVWTEGMTSWWPLHSHCTSMNHGKVAKELRVEAKPGGRLIEVSQDGDEYLWGTYRTFEPHTAVTLNFHMGMPPENASTLTVQFTPVDANRTSVLLTHSNWEAFGDMAEMMRGPQAYGSAWRTIFEGNFREACEVTSG